MTFWDMHDLALINLREEAIKITEEFEGKNISDKDYQKKLHNLLDEKLGKQIKALTKESISTTLKGISFPNRKV